MDRIDWACAGVYVALALLLAAFWVGVVFYIKGAV